MAVSVARTLALLLGVAAMLAGAPAGAAAQVFGEAETRFRAGPMDVTMRFSEDRVRGMETQIRTVLAGALERYTQLFGGPPRASDGQPLVNLVLRVQTDAGSAGGATYEAGLLQLVIGRQPLFGYYDWRLMLLHEAFHLWSDASVQGAGPGEEWFREGAAEFYALQTATRLGIVDDITAVRNMATTVGFYASAPGQDRLTFAEAGQQPTRYHILLTHGGATAILLLDYGLRSRTAGAKSMDDVMRWMYASFGPAKRYTVLDIARGTGTATGIDMGEFFARFIVGRLPLPVAATLNLGELGQSLQARRGTEVRRDALLEQSLGIADR